MLASTGTVMIGKFDQTDIVAIVDHYGRRWFTQETVAEALGVDRSSLSHLRTRHPDEFVDGEHTATLTHNGRRQVVYSEEGFMVVTDLSASRTALHLRRWARKQFNVRQDGDSLEVSPKGRENHSDLEPDLAAIQKIIEAVAEDRRRIRNLQHVQHALKQEQEDISERLTVNEAQVRTLEEAAKIQPGEMTAIQLASHVRWYSKSGAAHNLAVILAAFNGEYDLRGWMVRKQEQGPAAYGLVEVFVFTPSGIADFLKVIDARYHSGQRFEIAPTERSMAMGYRNTRQVLKG